MSTNTEHGPWNPGLSSTVPSAYLPLSTMFDPANVETSLDEAQELSDFCGLPAEQLVAFRTDRLTVHELLVRVTADLAVSDGDEYADLGINVRAIVSRILDAYVAPHAGELSDVLDSVRARATQFISDVLARDMLAPSGAQNPVLQPSSILSWIGFARSKASKSVERIEDREQRVLADWRRKAGDGQIDPFQRACFDALDQIVTAIIAKRGRLIGEPDLIVRLAVTQVSNSFGSDAIGDAIDPFIVEAVAAEGYRFLPVQDKPVVMNVKGASAAGKSTLRPLQQSLAEKIDTPWEDFALISPDIWRKFLLDYDTLGDAYKYAGMLSGHELEIIDKKLDAYMARKADDGRMSHLLIDRFRFDSFVPESEKEESSRLLTRFGDLVYMFFVITPPDATVERAWKRGLRFGRYKAVDDLLDHNVEAFTGMPQLFFTWALRTKKRVHYEFVDNSVPLGKRPRTVAFGWNGEMNILDIGSLLDIDRFRKIDIDAQTPEAVYPAGNDAADGNSSFLKDCARLLPVVNFADRETGSVYARLEQGTWKLFDAELIRQAMTDDASRAGLIALGFPADQDVEIAAERKLDVSDAHTLGAWGPG